METFIGPPEETARAERNDVAPKLNADEYPQLSLIAWSRVVREIEEDEAFALYERNWRFVEVENLLPHEAALIARLTQEYGGGVLNVNKHPRFVPRHSKGENDDGRTDE